MTSDRQLSANRQNSRRSSGPRSAAGSSRASRNALRHGLAAITCCPLVSTGVVDRLARAICGGDDDQRLFEAAIAIAQNCLARRAIKEQQVAVIERLRDKTAIALAKGDNSFNLGKARFLEIWIADKAIEARVPKLIEKYNVELPPRKYADSIASGWVWPTYRDPTSNDLVPLELKVLLEEPDSDEVQQRALDIAAKVLKHEERNDHEALKEALPDLKRLDRYERRVWSAQKRAIREFMNIKLLRRLENNHRH
jgi:hypothetical protein